MLTSFHPICIDSRSNLEREMQSNLNLRHGVLVRALCLPSQWRWGMEMDAAAKMQELLMCQKLQKHLRTATKEFRLLLPKEWQDLKCLYTSACSMSIRHGNFKAIVEWENLDIYAITETLWWDGSHKWSAQGMAMNPSGGICKEEKKVGNPVHFGCPDIQ